MEFNSLSPPAAKATSLQLRPRRFWYFIIPKASLAFLDHTARKVLARYVALIDGLNVSKT